MRSWKAFGKCTMSGDLFNPVKIMWDPWIGLWSSPAPIEPDLTVIMGDLKGTAMPWQVSDKNISFQRRWTWILSQPFGCQTESVSLERWQCWSQEPWSIQSMHYLEPGIRRVDGRIRAVASDGIMTWSLRRLRRLRRLSEVKPFNHRGIFQLSPILFLKTPPTSNIGRCRVSTISVSLIDPPSKGCRRRSNAMESRGWTRLKAGL